MCWLFVGHLYCAPEGWPDGSGWAIARYTTYIVCVCIIVVVWPRSRTYICMHMYTEMKTCGTTRAFGNFSSFHLFFFIHLLLPRRLLTTPRRTVNLIIHIIIFCRAEECCWLCVGTAWLVSMATYCSIERTFA